MKGSTNKNSNNRIKHSKNMINRRFCGNINNVNSDRNINSNL